MILWRDKVAKHVKYDIFVFFQIDLFSPSCYTVCDKRQTDDNRKGMGTWQSGTLSKSNGMCFILLC